MELKPLNASNIELSGKHLIEASAGTGKTFNITRLYLRLLLEKNLNVDQILVMTFTKDATEEIRGRIGEVLRDSLNNWQHLVSTDEFYQALSNNVSQLLNSKLNEQNGQNGQTVTETSTEINTEAFVIAKLKQALLYLDEAAIFTIHGFCKRLLSQYAFDSGLAFNLDMDTAGQDLILEACQDWYRLLAKQHPSDYLSLAQHWPHPHSFMQDFARALNKNAELQVKTTEQVIAHFKALIRQVQHDLLANEAFIQANLIDTKKGKDRETRAQELQLIQQWLTAQVENEELAVAPSSLTAFPAKFIHAGRFPKAIKPELVEIFAKTNQLKTLATKVIGQIKKSQAFVVVKQGIEQISALVNLKKEKHKQLTFDDLITTLAKLLEQDRDGKLAELLRLQYPVAMVDEFQDTDPEQFEILSTIYPADLNNALFLIGDPKQAIYGFRGGDIFTYLSARHFCQHLWLMDTNWRSSKQMINGYNRLFYGTPLQESGEAVFGYGIPYQPVLASPKAHDMALSDMASGETDKALQFVHFLAEEGEPDQTIKQNFRPEIALWCANKIKSLLQEQSSPLNAQDIAILVRDGSEADQIKQALQATGLSGVFLSNRANLWKSEQASQLLVLLKAILFVENDRYFIAGLASGLLPYQHRQLLNLQQDEMAWQNLKFDFLSLRDDWQYKGFISMAIGLLHEHVRVSTQDKDRALTNILHLFELLQSASQRYKQPQELVYWFEQQLDIELTDAQAELRLESDDDLIKIVTQHGSKGLEYPVVFVPFVTRSKDPTKVGVKKVNVVNYHDKDGAPCIALGSDSEHINTMAEEAYAESIRLLYVAVTRAERQCYMLTAQFDQFHLSPLGLTLKWNKETQIHQALQTLSNEQPEDIGVSVIQGIEQHSEHVSLEQQTSCAIIPEFKGKIERDWWLSSFTALSKNLRHAGVSLPDRDVDGEETSSLNDERAIIPVMRFALEKGAAAGNLLHSIFEHTDFSQDNWAESLSVYMDKYPELLSAWRVEELIHWIDEIINAEFVIQETDNNAISYRELNPEKMLHETEFYFPMVSADSTQLTDLLMAHRQTHAIENSTLRHVQLPHYQTLKGMMHGFIDLIFEHLGKFYICDYKSNYLGDELSDYSAQAIQANVEQHDYDLQYLIYSLALHRQLQTSIPNYNVEQHFGGVYYCYLRGMSSKSPEQYGVFHRTITANELDTLHLIFSGSEKE